MDCQAQSSRLCRDSKVFCHSNLKLGELLFSVILQHFDFINLVTYCGWMMVEASLFRYVSVNESELFFLFVESQGKPQHDPLLVYLAGGPGCSALTAFFFQVGKVFPLFSSYMKSQEFLQMIARCCFILFTFFSNKKTS